MGKRKFPDILRGFDKLTNEKRYLAFCNLIDAITENPILFEKFDELVLLLEKISETHYILVKYSMKYQFEAFVKLYYIIKGKELIKEKFTFLLNKLMEFVKRNRTVKKQKLSAVVFDCDGVLIESNAVKTRAFGQTVVEFGQKAMDQLMDYHREHGGISRFKKFEWFYSEVVKAPLSDELIF